MKLFSTQKSAFFATALVICFVASLPEAKAKAKPQFTIPFIGKQFYKMLPYSF